MFSFNERDLYQSIDITNNILYILDTFFRKELLSFWFLSIPTYFSDFFFTSAFYPLNYIILFFLFLKRIWYNVNFNQIFTY